MTEGDHTYTGRQLVLLHPGASVDGLHTLRNKAGIRLGSDADVSGPLTARNSYRSTHGYLVSGLDFAVTKADPDQLRALLATTQERGPIAMVEPERRVRTHPVQSSETATAATTDHDQRYLCTWGLAAVGANTSPFTGRGIRVAVLDTGIDGTHRDMETKHGIAQSFVDGENSHDHVGHGTHVAGTAVGPREPNQHPGYGVAPDADLFAGKVIDSAGVGTDGAVLSGISWAVRHRCAVVCLSLGAPVRPGEPYSTVFEEVARRATRAGTLIVAAAGNGSRRAEQLAAPVTHPANCPSVMAVGATNTSTTIAEFSNTTVESYGGAIDVVAPGVDVFSSWLGGYRQLSGTSMAAPHAAGIAALYAQSTGARGFELWKTLMSHSRRLNLASRDVGAGLVQAP
ncbi:S8 family serine peptidase [Saccharomonospora azurea]|uniref:S8 family serine peptidase n=1 Tax=Saccharomonospora azurea TaxID=40988 RepID=UPI00331F24A8